MPTGGLVAAPWSPRFAAPVVACCSPDGEEVEVESDGRPDALPAVAVAWDGAAVRWVQLRPDGTQVLRRQGDPAPTGTSGPTRQGLVALAPDRRSWVDPAAPTTLLIQDDRVAGLAGRPWPCPGGAWASGRRAA